MIPGVRRFSVLLLSQLSSHFHYDQFDAIYGLHGTMIINLCPLGLKFKQALIYITYIESSPSITLVPSTQKCTLVYTAAALNFIFIAKHFLLLRLYPQKYVKKHTRSNVAIKCFAHTLEFFQTIMCSDSLAELRHVSSPISTVTQMTVHLTSSIHKCAAQRSQPSGISS